MKKVLVTFGDSWPEGAELNGGKPYGELMHTQMNFDEFFNYGSGGASNEDMLFQYQRFLADHYRPEDSITAVFFLTNPSRTAHWPRFMSWNVFGEDRRHWPEDVKDQIKRFWLHFHDSQQEIMRNSTAISALQYWAQQHNIKDYYFSGWVKYPSWAPGVDTSKIWKQGQETAADWFGASKHNGEHLLDVGDNMYIRPNFAHPNQLGHQLIADKLAEWIQNK